jgi:hypothetical protein
MLLQCVAITETKGSLDELVTFNYMCTIYFKYRTFLKKRFTCILDIMSYKEEMNQKIKSRLQSSDKGSYLFTLGNFRHFFCNFYYITIFLINWFLLDELVCTQSTSNTEHFLRRDLHVC